MKKKLKIDNLIYFNFLKSNYLYCNGKIKQLQ